MMELKRTGKHDSWCRRIYVDRGGRKYVDVNLDDDAPEICSTCKAGEPMYPVTFKIVKKLS